MAAFLIANKNTEELETTVFESEGGDTVAVFTEKKNAQKYIDDAGWQDEMRVASLNPIPLIEWLLLCHHNGVKLMATDPVRAKQESGRRISTLEVKTQLEHAGRQITRATNRA